MFCPRSKTKTPGRGSVTSTGLSSSVTRTGPSAWATIRCGTSVPASRTASQSPSSKPGEAQPGVSARASYVSPFSRSAERIGPADASQSVSEVMRALLPSA